MNIVENITAMVEGIDNNRAFMTQLMEQIHADMGYAFFLGQKPTQEPNERDQSLFLILVQNYVAGFLTAECDPPDDFTDVVRTYYAKGIAHGHAYLQTRKEFQQ